MKWNLQDTTAIVNEYKKRIKKEYLPARGYGRASSRESKKVLSEFKKVAVYKKDIIDLILYRVEIMIEYTSTYGDIDEAFYNSLENSFYDACKMIHNEKLESEYSIYCLELVNKTDYMGWGLHDGLLHYYTEFIGETR